MHDNENVDWDALKLDWQGDMSGQAEFCAITEKGRVNVGWNSWGWYATYEDQVNDEWAWRDKLGSLSEALSVAERIVARHE